MSKLRWKNEALNGKQQIFDVNVFHFKNQFTHFFFAAKEENYTFSYLGAEFVWWQVGVRVAANKWVGRSKEGCGVNGWVWRQMDEFGTQRMG